MWALLSVQLHYSTDTRNLRPQIVQEIGTKKCRDMVEKSDALLEDMEERKSGKGKRTG